MAKIKLLGFITLPTSSSKLFTVWATINLVLTGVKAKTDVEDDKAIEGVQFSGEQSASGYTAYTPATAKFTDVITVDLAGLYDDEENEVTETDEDSIFATVDLAEEDVIRPDEITEGTLDGSEYHITDTDQVIDLSELTKAPGNISDCPIPPTVLPPLTQCPVSNSTEMQLYIVGCVNAVGTGKDANIACMEDCTSCCYDEKADDYVDCNPPPPAKSPGSFSLPMYALLLIVEGGVLVSSAVVLTLAYLKAWRDNVKTIGWAFSIPTVAGLLGGGVGAVVDSIVDKATGDDHQDVIITACSAVPLLGFAGLFGYRTLKHVTQGDQALIPLLQNP